MTTNICLLKYLCFNTTYYSLL